MGSLFISLSASETLTIGLPLKNDCLGAEPLGSSPLYLNKQK
jgi:hypothetical protein